MDRNTLKIIVQFLLRKAISQKLSLVELKPLELLNSESVRTPCSIKKFDVRYKLAYQKKMKTMSIVEKSSEKTKIQRELFFYKFVAPVYNYIDLSAAVGSKNWNQKFPNFYGGIISDTKFEDNALLSDNGVLLLENLKESGFETIGKSKKLNLDYAKVAIKHLGQFHACGKALSKYQPSLHKYIQEHPHNYQEVVQILKQTPQNWHDDEIQVFFDKLIDSVYKVCVLNIKKNNSTSIEQNINLESIMAAGLSGPWITLLHGDYRKDNILFKKEKKNQIGLKLLDFEDIRYGSVIEDLLSLFENTEECVQRNNVEFLLRRYVDEHNILLSKANCDYTRVKIKRMGKMLQTCCKLQLQKCWTNVGPRLSNMVPTL